MFRDFGTNRIQSIVYSYRFSVYDETSTSLAHMSSKVRIDISQSHYDMITFLSSKKDKIFNIRICILNITK